MTRDKLISIKSTEEFHKLLKITAAKKGLTIAEYVEKVMLADIQKGGE